MSDGPEDEDDNWFRPAWETEDEAVLDPPGRPRAWKPPAEPNYDQPLLTPLARSQDAVARLEARAEMASGVVAEGLRARMSYLEAAGWLRCVHIWIHPRDLALRDSGITGLVVTSVPKVTLRNPRDINGLFDNPWLNSLRTKRTLLSST